MSASHTPGPWKFQEIEMEGKVIGVALETLHRPISNNDPVIFAVREDWIRTFGRYGRAHYHPDHRLIEAAPDLLAAAKRALFLLGAKQAPELVAAIAKAEGLTPES